MAGYLSGGLGESARERSLRKLRNKQRIREDLEDYSYQRQRAREEEAGPTRQERESKRRWEEEKQHRERSWDRADAWRKEGFARADAATKAKDAEARKAAAVKAAAAREKARGSAIKVQYEREMKRYKALMERRQQAIKEAEALRATGREIPEEILRLASMPMPTMPGSPGAGPTRPFGGGGAGGGFPQTSPPAAPPAAPAPQTGGGPGGQLPTGARTPRDTTMLDGQLVDMRTGKPLKIAEIEQRAGGREWLAAQRAPAAAPAPPAPPAAGWATAEQKQERPTTGATLQELREYVRGKDGKARNRRAETWAEAKDVFQSSPDKQGDMTALMEIAEELGIREGYSYKDAWQHKYKQTLEPILKNFFEKQMNVESYDPETGKYTEDLVGVEHSSRWAGKTVADAEAHARDIADRFTPKDEVTKGGSSITYADNKPTREEIDSLWQEALDQQKAEQKQAARTQKEELTKANERTWTAEARWEAKKILDNSDLQGGVTGAGHEAELAILERLAGEKDNPEKAFKAKIVLDMVKQRRREQDAYRQALDMQRQAMGAGVDPAYQEAAGVAIGQDQQMEQAGQVMDDWQSAIAATPGVTDEAGFDAGEVIGEAPSATTPLEEGSEVVTSLGGIPGGATVEGLVEKVNNLPATKEEADDMGVAEGPGRSKEEYLDHLRMLMDNGDMEARIALHEILAAEWEQRRFERAYDRTTRGEPTQYQGTDEFKEGRMEDARAFRDREPTRAEKLVRGAGTAAKVIGGETVRGGGEAWKRTKGMFR